MFFDPASSLQGLVGPAPTSSSLASKGPAGAGREHPRDLHRLKINGLPAGSFTDARLRQLFSICGNVSAGEEEGSCRLGGTGCCACARAQKKQHAAR